MYIVHMWVGKGNGFRVHGLIKEGVIFCLNVFFTLVHCLSSLLSPAVCALLIVPPFSAGVGRTGTLIAIHSMVKMIEDVEEVDIFNFVLRMMAQRTYMVQTEVGGAGRGRRVQLHRRTYRHWV